LTAKDFTVIIRYVKSNVKEEQLLKNEFIMDYKGEEFHVRVGVIDLEGKFYTKIPFYNKDVEESYFKFINYHFKQE
jgi:hypothetical protein